MVPHILLKHYPVILRKRVYSFSTMNNVVYFIVKYWP